MGIVNDFPCRFSLIHEKYVPKTIGICLRPQIFMTDLHIQATWLGDRRVFNSEHYCTVDTSTFSIS